MPASIVTASRLIVFHCVLNSLVTLSSLCDDTLDKWNFILIIHSGSRVRRAPCGLGPSNWRLLAARAVMCLHCTRLRRIWTPLYIWRHMNRIHKLTIKKSYVLVTIAKRLKCNQRFNHIGTACDLVSVPVHFSVQHPPPRYNEASNSI